MDGHVDAKNQFPDEYSLDETGEDDIHEDDIDDINSDDSTEDECYNSESDRTSDFTSDDESYASGEKDSRHYSAEDNFFVDHSNVSISDPIYSFLYESASQGYACDVNSDEENNVCEEENENSDVIKLSRIDDKTQQCNHLVPPPRILINNYTSGLHDNSSLNRCDQTMTGDTYSDSDNIEKDGGENPPCRNIPQWNEEERQCPDTGLSRSEQKTREKISSTASPTTRPKLKKLKRFLNRLTNGNVHKTSNVVKPENQITVHSPSNITCGSMGNSSIQSKRKRLMRIRFHKNCISPKSKIRILNEKSKYTLVKVDAQDDTRDDDEVYIISCVQRVVVFTRQGKSKLVKKKSFDSKFIGNPEYSGTILEHRKRRIERFPRKHGQKSFCVQGPQAQYFLQAFSIQTHLSFKKVKITKKLENKDHVFYTFEGKNKNIHLTGLILNKLKLRIKDYTVDIRSEFLNKQELHLVTKGTESPQFQDVVQTFQKCNQCIIHIDRDENKTDSVFTVTFYFDTGKFNHITATERNPSVLIGRWLWAKLKIEIESQCLFEDCFELGAVVLSPDNFRTISEQAHRRSLDLKKQSNNLIIRGEKSAVGELMTCIHRLVIKPPRPNSMPKKDITSSFAPPRDTVNFLKFASSCPPSIPSYWSLSNSTYGPVSSTQAILENVGSVTRSAIEKLVNKTWISKHVGHGRDARGLRHNYIKVTDVKRVENPSLFKAYSARRTLMFESKSADQRVCTPVGQLQGSSGPVLTTDNLEEFMKRELYREVNEHYLFHGTHPESVDPIINCGLDPRVSSPSCMWGAGIYAAESTTKSDQYTGKNGRECIMLLTRVLLGDVYLCGNSQQSAPQKLTRPPCVHCNKDKCLCPNQRLYDSIMADGHWLFREFIVYDKSQCYPEYVIKYQRE